LHRHCLSIPKWLHLLRSSPSWESTPGLLRVDHSERSTLANIINVQLSDSSWSQASLPVRWGGVGVRSLLDLAPSAFLSSAFLTRPFIELLLQPIALASFEATVSEAVTHWDSQSDFPSTTGTLRVVQRAWDDASCGSRLQSILSDAAGADRACLLESSSEGSGSWMHAFPSANLGLLLTDGEVRVSVGLCLGAKIVSQHTCVCGSVVQSVGHHGLSCKRSAGRHSSHHAKTGTHST